MEEPFVSHSRGGVFPIRSTIPRFRIHSQHSKVSKNDIHGIYLMQNYCNLEDFHNGALSSFKPSLSNVTAIARIYVMEMRTVFIYSQNIQQSNKTTAIHQHGPINVWCLTTSIHVHVTGEHSKPQTHFKRQRQKRSCKAFRHTRRVEVWNHLFSPPAPDSSGQLQLAIKSLWCPPDGKP